MAQQYNQQRCCDVELCRRNYHCKFVDDSDFLDGPTVLNYQKDLRRYRKRVKYYARIQLLFIDDFDMSRYTERCTKILYKLMRLWVDLETSIFFNCQYAPNEWINQVSDVKECYGKFDVIRRRLTMGFIVLIEKAHPSTTIIKTDTQGGVFSTLRISVLSA